MTAVLAAVNAYLRAGSLRFSVLYIAGFFGGAAFANSDALGAGAVAGWIAYWMVFCLAVELLNRVFDIRADRINQPHRTRLALLRGGRSLVAVAWTLWFAVLAISVVLTLTETPSWPIAVVLTVNLLVGIGYSYKGIAKRHPVAVLILLTATMYLPFLTGTVMAGGGSPLVTAAVCVLLASVSMAIAGAKDITDTVGDHAIAYQSAWLHAVRSGLKNKAVLVCGAQFILITAVALIRIPEFAAAYLVIPLELSIAWAVAAVSSNGNSAAAGRLSRTVREFMYLVTLLSVLVICLALTFDVRSVATAATCLVLWFVLSRHVHWHRDLTFSSIFELVGTVLTSSSALTTFRNRETQGDSL